MRSRTWFLISLMVLATPGPASANFYELLRRVPDSANTLILIDVEQMLMSPIAMREKWREKINASEGPPLHFPVNSKRCLLASKLDFTTDFQSQWDIAMIETIEGVSLPMLSRSEGGYLETVENQEVAYSPRNAFIVAFRPTILGVFFPANRQDLARWVRTTQRHEASQVSKYLQDAVKLVHGKDQMVIAFDMGDVLTTRMVRDRLHQAESLAGKNLDLDEVTKVLLTIQGVTLTVTAADRLEGRVRIDFAGSPTPIKNIARALIFEVLEKNGMMLDEMRDWRILPGARDITLTGRLSTQGLRTLTDLIPVPTDTIDLKGAVAKPGQAPPATAEAAPSAPSTASSTRPSSSENPDPTAVASLKYFQRVTLRLGDLRRELKNSQKAKIAQRMVNDAALELDRLPILNVDEELLAYGAGVSASLRNMRNLSKNASLDYQYRKAAIQANSAYGYGGFYGGGSVVGATTATHRQEEALLQSNELAILTMLEEKTAEIRRKMTAKYKIEF
jgi:hypothetical protein